MGECHLRRTREYGKEYEGMRQDGWMDGWVTRDCATFGCRYGMKRERMGKRKGRTTHNAAQHNTTVRPCESSPWHLTSPRTNPSSCRHSTTTTTITTPCVPSHRISPRRPPARTKQTGQTDRPHKHTDITERRQEIPSSAPSNTTPRYHTIAPPLAPHPNKIAPSSSPF